MNKYFYIIATLIAVSSLPAQASKRTLADGEISDTAKTWLTQIQFKVEESDPQAVALGNMIDNSSPEFRSVAADWINLTSFTAVIPPKNNCVYK